MAYAFFISSMLYTNSVLFEGTSRRSVSHWLIPSIRVSLVKTWNVSQWILYH